MTTNIVIIDSPYIILFLTWFSGAETQINRWKLPSIDAPLLWYCDVTQTPIMTSFWPIVMRTFPSGSRASSRRRQVDYIENKANLRDLIAATGLVILFKLDSNRRFFSPCDLEIWWMTPKNNRPPLLYYIKFCASFQIHQWIQTGKCGSKLTIFLFHVTLNFDKWPRKTIGHLFNATSSFLHHFVASGELKLELQSGNAQFGSKLTVFLAA